jgi:hypothetical protein
MTQSQDRVFSLQILLHAGSSWPERERDIQGGELLTWDIFALFVEEAENVAGQRQYLNWNMKQTFQLRKMTCFRDLRQDHLSAMPYSSNHACLGGLSRPGLNMRMWCIVIEAMCFGRVVTIEIRTQTGVINYDYRKIRQRRHIIWNLI